VAVVPTLALSTRAKAGVRSMMPWLAGEMSMATGPALLWTTAVDGDPAIPVVADGIVIVKTSTPRATETEITIGKAGTSEKTTSADFTLEVQEKGTNRVYAVDVDQAHYDKVNVGEPFRFILPQGTEPLRVINP